MRAKHYTISYFICSKCGKSLPLPRNRSLKRKKGHIKTLYCVFCNKETDTLETRDGDYVTYSNKQPYIL